MSPHLNPIEHLWHDLRTAVGRRHPSNVRDLEQLAKEEWSKIPVERWKKLIHGYRKRLQLFFPKGDLPNINLRVPIILSSPFLEFCAAFFSFFFVLFQCLCVCVKERERERERGREGGRDRERERERGREKERERERERGWGSLSANYFCWRWLAEGQQFFPGPLDPLSDSLPLCAGFDMVCCCR